MTRRIVQLLLLLGTTGLANGQGIRINEFMAANATAVPEFVDYGDFEDWIELFNTGSSAVDLGGYGLSDDRAVPRKWVFPAGSIVDPMGFYLVWADGHNDVAGEERVRPWWPGDVRFTTRWNHTNFRLSRSAEAIYLFDPSGVAMDSVLFGSQLDDVSLGRHPDGSGPWKLFGESTPLAANQTPPLTVTTHASGVSIEPQAGRYTGLVHVSMANQGTAGTLHYSLDGSRPTRQSPVYTGPIVVSSTTTVRGRVIEDGRLPGPIASSTFLVATNHTLPVVSIAADPDLLWHSGRGIYLNSLKDREAPVDVEFFFGSSRATHISAGARIGGENVFRFAQKPLNLYFRTGYGAASLDYPVFDQLPFVSWKRLYLRNGGDDWPHTMMRDGFQASLLAGLDGSAVQAYRPAVLYLNGDYWGIYNLREKIDEQYFRLHYGVDPANLDHLESTTRIITGDSTHYAAVLDFADSQDLRLPANYGFVAERIDVESLMDFVIVESFVANGSWSHNREMWRDRAADGQWKWIVVDLDRGYDIARVGTDRLSEIHNGLGLFNRLVQNQDFRDQFIARYALHLNTTFQPERAIRTIDSLAAAIQSEIPRHSERWGTYIDSLSIPRWGIESGISSYASWQNAVENLRRFAAERPDQAAQDVVSLFGLSGSAQVTIDASPPGAARLGMNDFDISSSDTFTLFQDVPVSIRAEAAPGYAFRHWVERRSDAQQRLVPLNSVWKYLDGGQPPGSDWATPGFDDGAWMSGSAELGYGDGDEATEVSFGPDPQNKYMTTWFRSEFEVPDATAFSDLTIDLVRDDGAAVYLNGTEILRSGLPDGVITPSTAASGVASGADESRPFWFSIDPGALVAGTNMIAVEVHQVSSQSSDISFNLSLSATRIDPIVDEVVIDEDPTLRSVPTGDAVLTAVFDPESVNRIAAVISTDTRLLAGESPYIVEGTVIIEPGVTLSADAGVRLQLAGDASLMVHGRLLFSGSAEQPIWMEPYYAGVAWGGVCLADATAASLLQHVAFTGAAGHDADACPAALTTERSPLTIIGGSFTDVALPVIARESHLIVDGVRFARVTAVGDYITADGGTVEIRNSEFEGNALEDMDAIDVGLLAPGSIISHNHIHGFSGPNSDGIDLGDGSRDVMIESNRIHDMADKGVSIGQGSSGLITRNVIARTLLGVGVKDSLSSAHVRHSTFLQNGIGVAVFEKNPGRGGAYALIEGSLFSASSEADVSADLLSTVQVTYSLSDRAAIAGTGNLHADTRLIHPDGLNVGLQVHSAAIDAGDPTSAPDPDDGSRADIGAVSFSGFGDGPIVLNEINYHSETNFDPEDWVELYNRSSETVDLTDWVPIDGGFVASLVFDSGVSLPPDAFLVSARDMARFGAAFPTAGPLVGPFSRGLGGNGDALYLYDDRGVLVDSVAYSDTLPWPTDPDGAGPTLELISPDRDNAVPTSWSASTGHGTPGVRNSMFVTDTDPAAELPTEFALQAPYPNPFNPSTTITYALPEAARVSLRVYDLLGRQVELLVDEHAAPGIFSLAWSTRGLPSGMYLLSLTASAGERTHRLTRTAILTK